MKNLVRSLAILSIVGSMVPFALAGGNPHCPKCKMELASKKDKKHSVAVKLGKKTFYCCSSCGAHSKGTHKTHPTHPAHHEPTPKPQQHGH